LQGPKAAAEVNQQGFSLSNALPRLVLDQSLAGVAVVGTTPGSDKGITDSPDQVRCQPSQFVGAAVSACSPDILVTGEHKARNSQGHGTGFIGNQLASTPELLG